MSDLGKRRNFSYKYSILGKKDGVNNVDTVIEKKLINTT